MFTQSVKTYTFHCHILRSTDVWKRWFIKQTQNERLLLSASFTANFELVFDLTDENAFLRGFILKSTERALKCYFEKQYLGFSNKPPFERSVCLYVIITGNSERFQCSTLKQIFWKTKTVLKKKLPSQRPM